MKVETIGKSLIAVGAIVLLYAKNMSITVGDSGIVNIHLISERQNTLLLGGFLFLAGIILFAVFKLKQTKEEVALEVEKQNKRTDKAKVLANNVYDKASSVTSAIQEDVRIGFSKQSLATSGRLLTGFVTGAICSLALWRGVYETLHYVMDYKMNGDVALALIVLSTFGIGAYSAIDVKKWKAVASVAGALAVIAVAVNFLS